MNSLPPEIVATPGGLLLVLLVLVPFTGVLAGLALGGRHARRVAMAVLVIGLGLAIALGATAAGSGVAPAYLLGGWAPPLGIALRADPLALAMIPAIAVVMLAIGLYARADFDVPADLREARAPLVFWTLVLAIWGALNLVFVSGDLFTLYVALELLTFAAVPLVSLDGSGETLRAALRYLLYALAGSILYLLGAVLVYGTYGTLDIALLGERVRPDAATVAAAALMTAGLLAKTALFPLHLWLPPAHAGAPPAASAVLSGLVVKGSWFLVVRLWFDVFPGVVSLSAAQLLGGLGAAAIVVANVVALRQVRLKLLVAYSTVAQIGYLFLLFPLAFDAAGRLERGDALAGGLLQAISHASAKAAMFMAAGLIYRSLGHDRIAGLAGTGRAQPLAVLTFAIAGLALMGLPPSGAYVAKKLFLDAASASDQWWWAVVLDAGGLLTASYVVLILVHALQPAPEPRPSIQPVSRLSGSAAFALAVASLALGVVAAGTLDLDGASALPGFSDLASALLLLAGGALVAAALAPELPPIVPGGWLSEAARPLRRAALAAGGVLARVDAVARQWPVASLALIAVAALFGAAMVAGR